MSDVQQATCNNVNDIPVQSSLSSRSRICVYIHTYIRASHILLSSRKRKERSRVSSRISDCRANFYLAIKIWRTNDNGSEKFLRISCRIEFRSFFLFFHLLLERIEKFRRSEDGNLSNKHGALLLRAWLLASQLLPTSIYPFPHYPIIQFRGGPLPLPCFPSSSPQHKQKPLVSFFTALSVYLLVTLSEEQRGTTIIERRKKRGGGKERKRKRKKLPRFEFTMFRETRDTDTIAFFSTRFSRLKQFNS